MASYKNSVLLCTTEIASFTVKIDVVDLNSNHIVSKRREKNCLHQLYLYFVSEFPQSGSQSSAEDLKRDRRTGPGTNSQTWRCEYSCTLYIQTFFDSMQ